MNRKKREKLELKFAAAKERLSNLNDKTSKLMGLLYAVDSCGENLSRKELRFISKLIDFPPLFFSEKQEIWLKKIYDEKCC